MRINWEIFFGDSSSEEAVCLFANGSSTFNQFLENCSYSVLRKSAIKSLKNRGYKRARRSAQKALLLRGFYSYKDNYIGDILDI
jgi:hypothetical protein